MIGADGAEAAPVPRSSWRDQLPRRPRQGPGQAGRRDHGVGPAAHLPGVRSAGGRRGHVSVLPTPALATKA